MTLTRNNVALRASAMEAAAAGRGGDALGSADLLLELLDAADRAQFRETDARVAAGIWRFLFRARTAASA
jgi:hypothetical protein